MGPYLVVMDPDLGGLKACGSRSGRSKKRYGSGSATLLITTILFELQDGKETNGLSVRDGEPWSAAGVLPGTSARSHSSQRKGTNEDSVGFWPGSWKAKITHNAKYFQRLRTRNLKFLS